MTWPQCPTCRQPRRREDVDPKCVCGHRLSAHRIDLKVWACNSGCGVINPCDCPAFEAIHPVRETA